MVYGLRAALPRSPFDAYHAALAACGSNGPQPPSYLRKSFAVGPLSYPAGTELGDKGEGECVNALPNIAYAVN